MLQAPEDELLVELVDDLVELAELVEPTDEPPLEEAPELELPEPPRDDDAELEEDAFAEELPGFELDAPPEPPPPLLSGSLLHPTPTAHAKQAVGTRTQR